MCSEIHLLIQRAEVECLLMRQALDPVLGGQFDKASSLQSCWLMSLF